LLEDLGDNRLKPANSRYNATILFNDEVIIMVTRYHFDKEYSAYEITSFGLM
jgi:hypothetical protein